MNDKPEDRCGDPNCNGEHIRTFAQITEDTMNTILEHGHQVIGVFGDEHEDFLSYSVGRSVRGKPEFVITGPLPMHVSGYMINEAAKHMDEDSLPVGHGYEFLPDTLLDGYGVRVIRANPNKYPVNTIRRLFGAQEFTLLQLLWPDAEGIFPDEPGYTGPAQPVHPLEESNR